MIFSSFLMAATPLPPVIYTTAPPLEADGWELVWEADEPRRRRVFVSPISVRPVSRTERLYSVTSITEFMDSGGEWKFVTMGFVVDCDRKTIRQDWHFVDRKGESLITYRSTEFRAPKGSQAAIVDKTCELS